MRVRALIPHKFAKAVRAVAGEVLDVPAEVAKVLLAARHAEQTQDPVGPFVDPEPTGYASWSRDELVVEARARGIEGIGLMGVSDLVAALGRDGIRSSSAAAAERGRLCS